MAAVVELIDVDKQYQLGQVPVTALTGVNVEIQEGEFVAILGPSGSGKTTMLNLIGALDRPTNGVVQIEGTDLSKLSDSQIAKIRQRIGIVFQFFNLIPRLNAAENVELPMSINNLGHKERRERAQNLLQTVGLKDRLNHSPAELSGGERQRVAIARALANDPHFLLMDEPTGNIDSKTALELMDLISDLNRTQKITLIMVTHDQRIADYATRQIHLLDGKIVREVKS